MPDSSNMSGRLFRLLMALRARRSSETILLSCVLGMGLLILCIHLATWGRGVRHDARHMKPAVCVVVEKAARERQDEDGELRFRPELHIHYQYAARDYDSWTFDRFTLTADQGYYYDREGAERILDAYAVGKFYRCWILDDDPSQAIVIKPSYVWGWIFLIIPAALILFPATILIVRARVRALSKEELADRRKQATDYPNVPVFDGEKGLVLAKRLKSDVKSTFRFSATVVGALVWNLASWIAFAYVLIVADSSAEYAYAAVFGALFCGVGALFACRLYRLYRVERVVGSSALEISQIPVVPGRKARICLFLNGRIEAKRLELYIRCEEVARYVQGTNTVCHRNEVFTKPILTKYALDVPAKTEERVEGTFMLPIGVPHSFVAEHNEIDWKIVAKMEFGDGAVYTRAFEVIVRPYLGSKTS